MTDGILEFIKTICMILATNMKKSGEWVDGWKDGLKTVLRIAYSNQKDESTALNLSLKMSCNPTEFSK